MQFGQASNHMKWTKIKNEGFSSIFKSDCSVATGKRMHKGDLAGPIITWSGSCKKGKVPKNSNRGLQVKGEVRLTPSKREYFTPKRTFPEIDIYDRPGGNYPVITPSAFF